MACFKSSELTSFSKFPTQSEFSKERTEMQTDDDDVWNEHWEISSCENIMDSIGKDCNELKQKYDACFNAWFSEQFLKKRSDTLDQCEPLFKEYQKCVKAAIEKNNIPLWELEKEILGTEKEKQPPPVQDDSTNS